MCAGRAKACCSTSLTSPAEVDMNMTKRMLSPVLTTMLSAMVALMLALMLAACGGSGEGGNGGGGGPVLAADAPQVAPPRFSVQVTFGDNLSDVGSYAVGSVAGLGGGKFTINGDASAYSPE